MQVIAMAGLAEAAEAYSLLTFSTALLLAAGLLAFAWWKKCPMAAAIGFLICIVVGLMTQPWTEIVPVFTDDPDVTYWVFRWRVFAFFWAALSIVAVLCFCTSIRGFASRSTNNPAETKITMRLNWFRQWGWLYLPASIPGAVICLVTLGFCASVFLAIDRHSHSASDTLYGVFPFFTCAFLLWDWIGARTSN